jgi:putative transposase
VPIIVGGLVNQGSGNSITKGIDIFSRRIVGWSMKRRIQKELIEDALKMTIKARMPPAGLILHTDRGGQERLL